ncbi:MAG: CBS domain-containing protein [Candidatus Bathyarchaeia archaeon]
MLPPLEDIEKRRRRLGINQRQLAKLAGVSQSLIAKIEAGQINPSYQKTKQIFDTLEMLERRVEHKAKDIYHKGVVGVNKDDLVVKATRIMHEGGYSQLPVFDGEKVVGSITEKTILDSTIKGISIDRLSRMRVGEIMGEPFPLVDESAPLPAISALLQYTPAVLVTKMGKIVGIITKADLLKVVGRP